MHVAAEGTIRRAVVLLVLVLAAVLALTAVVHSMRPATGQEQMVAVSPGGEVQLDELRPELQQMYLDVAEDPDAFSQVRCYCGCEAMLDHRHLGDCFVRPDGGWERHAVGCGICQLEARDVLAARAAGTPIDDIVADIDAAYAGITEEDA